MGSSNDCSCVVGLVQAGPLKGFHHLSGAIVSTFNINAGLHIQYLCFLNFSYAFPVSWSVERLPCTVTGCQQCLMMLVRYLASCNLMQGCTAALSLANLSSQRQPTVQAWSKCRHAPSHMS